MESLYYGDKEIKKIMYWGEQVWPEPEPIDYIELTAITTTSNQTVRVNKYFNNSFDVDWWDGSPVANHTADTTHAYSAAGTYKIKLTLAWGATRWTFKNTRNPLVPTAWTTANNVYISKMPSLADYFGENATNPGNAFFSSFNQSGALTSLPAGSFDTSNITTVGDAFFFSFNQSGALTSLPAGSFDTSNITTVGAYFFSSFNYDGDLTSLPAGSFILSQLPVASRTYYFSYFNYSSWKLTKQVWGIQLKNAHNAAIDFHYWNWSSTVTESVSSWNSFNWYTES